MFPKSGLNHNKLFLITGQIGILGIAMALLFWFMVLGNKERIENDLRMRLDSSTQAMAAQLKANQVPFSQTSVEPGVFIINQTDGSVVIDRRNNAGAGQKLWDGYKTKIIYEMQKQKRGWIEYPDKISWNFSQPQRIIRYISIDELNWILAIEDLKPSAMDLIKASVNPSTCFMIFFIFVLGAAALWFMTLQYFDLIKRQIADSVEKNILSLNGEEKLWGKSHEQIPPMNDIDKEVGLEFSTSKAVAVDDPIMEEIFHKPSIGKVINPIKANIPVSTKGKSKETQKETPKEKFKEIPKEPVTRAVDNNDMAVDVQDIKSPALKKMLQQFREK